MEITRQFYTFELVKFQFQQILIFWNNFPKHGYFQTKTKKINITNEFFISE